jgi:hypothetical protein
MSGEASGASVKECVGDVRPSLARQPVARPPAGSSMYCTYILLYYTVYCTSYHCNNNCNHTSMGDSMFECIQS